MDLGEFLTSLGISWMDYSREWRPLGQESMYIILFLMNKCENKENLIDISGNM